MHRDDMMGPDGENMAVHAILRHNQNPESTIDEMRDYMVAAGWVGCWPEWVSTAQTGEPLTTAHAQAWIRHLLALEMLPAPGLSTERVPTLADVHEELTNLCLEFGWSTAGDAEWLTFEIRHKIRDLVNAQKAAQVDAVHQVRDAQRALKSIRRVIEQDTAREGEKATLALFLDDDVNTLQQFVDAQRRAGAGGSQGEVASPSAITN